MTVENAVRELLCSSLLRGRPEAETLADDDPLLDSGLIDSMGIMELTSILEAHFQITIDDDEIVPERFESVRTIAALVEEKLPASG